MEFLRWFGLDWGLLAHKNYYFRAINPFLLRLYTKDSFILLLTGTAVALFQSRAFLPFGLLLLLTLDYKKTDKLTYAGCLLFFIANIIYHLYTTQLNGNFQ